MTPSELAPRAGLRAATLGLFLLSGATGLVYEVAWARMLTLVLGTTVHAVSVVLATYMGGMALGSWLFGRAVERPGAQGLRLYGLLELGVGVYALGLPWLLQLGDAAYCALWPAVGDSALGVTGLRLLLAAAILLPPTTLMGGTLPALSRVLVRDPGGAGREVGRLYALNTLGATAGCFLTGFFLLELLGVRTTVIGTALVNCGIAAGALCLSRGAPRSWPSPAGDSAPASAPAAHARAALAAGAFTGFAALALEVLWTRSLMYFVHIDTWAFTAMLSTFLAGLGIGSLAMAGFASRLRRPLRALALLQLLTGFLAAASIPAFGVLHGALRFDVAGAPLLGQIARKLLGSAAIMLLPTLLMGAAFPLTARLWVGWRQQAGRGTGTLYALSTLGAILGSLLAGIVLTPWLGLERAILLAATLYAACGLWLWVVSAATRRFALPLALAAAAGLLGANLAFRGRPLILRSGWFLDEPGKYRLLFHREGADASLAVLEKANGIRELNINGFSTAADNYQDLQVHRMLSHLPMLLHPAPRRVLVVGFGTGSTAWGCCQHEDARVDVVEMLQLERETAPYFARVNHDVLHHPRLRFIHGDGRNHLLATRERYDVISFNAIHPRYSANLYTVDFYRLCRERLAPGGIVCAWLTQASLTDAEWRMLCRSVVDVLPHTSLWYCNPQHFCLLGSTVPLAVDWPALARRMASPGVREDLRDSNLDDPAVLAARLLLEGDRLRGYVAGAPRNTDDRPLVEFTRELIHEEAQVIRGLIEGKQSIVPAVRSLAADERQRLERFEQSSTWMMRGQAELWYPTGRLRAEIAHRRALLSCPQSEDVRFNLGLGRTWRAQIVLALERDPDAVQPLADLGRLQWEDGDWPAAETTLLRVLALRPGHAGGAEDLAFVRLLLGKNEPAAALYRQLVLAAPGSATAAMGLSLALQRMGSSEEAARWAATARAKDADAAALLELREATARQARERRR